MPMAAPSRSQQRQVTKTGRVSIAYGYMVGMPFAHAGSKWVPVLWDDETEPKFVLVNDICAVD
jgi:hypothetical protein